MPMKLCIKAFKSMHVAAMHMQTKVMKKIVDKKTGEMSKIVVRHYRDKFHAAQKKAETAKKVSEKAKDVMSDMMADYLAAKQDWSLSEYKQNRKIYREAKKKVARANKALEKAEDVMAAKMDDYWAAKNQDSWSVLKHYRKESPEATKKVGESREAKKKVESETEWFSVRTGDSFSSDTVDSDIAEWNILKHSEFRMK